MISFLYNSYSYKNDATIHVVYIIFNDYYSFAHNYLCSIKVLSTQDKLIVGLFIHMNMKH